MKFLILAILLLLTSRAWAAYAVISSTIAGSAAGNSVTTSAIDTTGGTILIAGLSGYSGGSAPVLTDSKNNGWTRLSVSSVTSNLQTFIYYSSNPVVGSGHTFTESATNSFPTLSVIALSGSTGLPFDQETGSNSTGSSASFPTGSVTPTQDNELIVTVSNYEAVGTISINSGFTISNQINAPGASYTSALAYLIQTSAAAVNPTWSQSGSFAETTRIATFKAAAVTPPASAAFGIINNPVPGGL